MKKAIDFITSIVREVIKDELISLANELSYKILLAFFPFLMFLMALLGFFNIDGNMVIEHVYGLFTDDIVNIIRVFIDEVINQRSVSLLSTSLFVSVFNASSGFKAVIRGINKAYGQKETRGIVRVTAISVGMVFLFAASIIMMLVVLIFGDFILELISGYFELNDLALSLFNTAGFVVIIFILMVFTMIIYKISSCRKLTFKSVFPGAALTVIAWVASSEIFNFYVVNFSRYSKVYGSIAGLFILIIWLNLISIILLLGIEINAAIEKSSQ